MNFPVDLVYLWCDGSDPSFKNRKNRYINDHTNKKLNIVDGDNSLQHIIQFDEIKYSLRSVEKYMPWINHIYIVVDQQKPKFINFENSKISLIDIKVIMPNGVKELYNTNAIESLLYKIPNLSEHFLIASDDYFVNKKVSVNYFFTNEGKPIVYLRKYYTINNNFSLQIFNAYSEIFKKYHPNSYWAYTHNIDPYLISDFEKVSVSQYASAFEATGRSALRCNYNVNRYFVSLYSSTKGTTILKKISFFKSLWTNSYCEYKYSWIINLFNPFLFCLNAPAHFSNKSKNKALKFLNKKFPNKSEFEN